MCDDVLMYQTRGSAGRKAAKWHRPNGHGYAACTGLPIAAVSVQRASQVPVDRRCRTKACAIRPTEPTGDQP